MPQGVSQSEERLNGGHVGQPVRRRPLRGKSRHIPALDGLRCFAVLAVIAYHMKLDWAPGGLLGVTMFFVLSGYLITGLLLREYQETRTISLKHFWIRRVRRIIPAVVFAVFGTAILCAIFNHALLTKMRPDVIPTLLFFNNWWQIFHDVSYFEALGQPSPLMPYWSLSIEEQYYLIWPIVLLVAMKLGAKKSTLRNATLVLALLSTLEMALLYNPHVDPSRIYYGTDTRAASLLIGSFLAFVWPYQRLTKRAGEHMTPVGRGAFNAVGFAAIIGLVLMVVFTNGFDAFIYRGGLLLCSLLTALAIAVMVHPISLLGKILGWKPFEFIGKISYSMYLWHYPIILILTPTNTTGPTPWWLCLIELALIIGISSVSYFLVENPIHHGAIGRVLAGAKQGRYTLGQWLRAHIAGAIACVVFLVAAIGSLIFVPSTSAVERTDLLQGQVTTTVQKAVEKQVLFVQAQREEMKLDMLLIGDSVPEAVGGYGTFAEYFPTGFIDAVKNRQYWQAAELYKGYKDASMIGDVVVIALGTNGYTTDADIDALMQEVGSDQQIWLVNTRSPEDYVESNNEVIARAAERYPNVHLIDWYEASADHDEYFDGDGTHLTPDATRVYAQLIMDAVGDSLPNEAKGNPVS